MEERDLNEKNSTERYLLWDCFVNWATTLEKLEKKLGAEH